MMKLKHGISLANNKANNIFNFHQHEKRYLLMTPKELGKWAKTMGINAPTLDAGFSCWIKSATKEERKQYLIEWWDGWYEALDESLSFQKNNYENRSAA